MKPQQTWGKSSQETAKPIQSSRCFFTEQIFLSFDSISDIHKQKSDSVLFREGLVFPKLRKLYVIFKKKKKKAGLRAQSALIYRSLCGLSHGTLLSISVCGDEHTNPANNLEILFSLTTRRLPVQIIFYSWLITRVISRQDRYH